MAFGTLQSLERNVFLYVYVRESMLPYRRSSLFTFILTSHMICYVDMGNLYFHVL